MVQWVIPGKVIKNAAQKIRVHFCCPYDHDAKLNDDVFNHDDGKLFFDCKKGLEILNLINLEYFRPPGHIKHYCNQNC